MRVVEISDPSSFHTEQWARQLMDREIETHVVYVRGWYPWEEDRILKLEGCYEQIFSTPGSKGMVPYLLRRGKLGALSRGMLNRTRLYGELEYLKPHLHDYMTSNNIDVIHAHYLHSGCFLAYASGFQPTVMSTWGSDLTDGPEKYPYYIPLMKKTLESATIVQPASEVSAHLVNQLYPIERNRMFVTSWGADTNLFKPDLDTSDLREELSIPSGLVILSFRTLEPYYRIDLIIRAFKMIAEDFQDVSLVIGNDGYQREELEGLCEDLMISNRVFFTGRVFNKKMAQLFALADIYIQCPLSDGVSVSGLQALATGLPIIANNVGETQAIVEDELNGFLLDDSDKPEAYASALKTLIEDEDLRIQMSKESRRLSESKHDRNKILDKFEKLFTALAQGASNLDSITFW
jgi:glycosyltransferase involved in cell wall biosynthesis